MQLEQVKAASHPEPPGHYCQERNTVSAEYYIIPNVNICIFTVCYENSLTEQQNNNPRYEGGLVIREISAADSCSGPLMH